MQHETGKFEGTGGLELTYQSWHPDPDQERKAVLVIVHGLGEHSGRYGNVVKELLPRGIVVYGFDLRGHGRSAGQRGHVESWSDIREDLDAFSSLVIQQEGDLPRFLMGHSLGGLIVLEYTLRKGKDVAYQGVIASGPGLSTDGLSPVLVQVSSFLSRVWPTLSMPSGLEVPGISRDPAVVQAYRDDPLVHGKVTPRGAVGGFAAVRWTLDHAADWSLPLLIVHGGADRLVPAEASRSFFDQLPITDKERIEYEGGYHEPHNDINHKQVTSDLARWLSAHLV
jgi:alpha-beta hydrolase superfamily lysophospholipase